MMPTAPEGQPRRLDAAVDHETRLFLLCEGSSVQPLAHDRYVALARNETVLPEFAGCRFILVDWYLRIVGGQAQDVVNETCAWLVFDAQGRLDAHGSQADCKAAHITLDTDMAGRRDAFNPAELLLAALSACMIKSIERVPPLLKFGLRGVEVRVHGVRQDVPPRMETIRDPQAPMIIPTFHFQTPEKYWDDAYANASHFSCRVAHGLMGQSVADGLKTQRE